MEVSIETIAAIVPQGGADIALDEVIYMLRSAM
jgi:hypothetical protein